MPSQSFDARRLKWAKEASDRSAANAYDSLRAAVADTFENPNHSASEIAAAAAINGYDETIDRLKRHPEYFGTLKETADPELGSVMTAFATYDAAAKTYWQARDELDLYRAEHEFDDELER